MADSEDQPNLPPIPDGGLTESMPDWLRRPPAWRTLPDREVAVPEPEETATLPEPDDSVIDPRTFLSDDDLPAWLRKLGPGRGQAAPVDVEPERVPAEAASSDDVSPTSDQPATRAPARFVPVTPPVSETSPSTREHQVANRTQPRGEPDRKGAGLGTILAALLVIALIVIVILLVI